MKAMILKEQKKISFDDPPLQMTDIPKPVLKNGEILVKINACAVCHTDLDEIEGRIKLDNLPLVLGHQIIGRVEETRSTFYNNADRVGIGWIYSSCGVCEYCLNDNENLCHDFKATGKDANGGYAEYISVKEGYAYNIPENIDDISAAPLLCAGGVGYRALKLSGIKNGECLGFTGFGASAHILLKLVKLKYPEAKTYVFARSKEQRDFALSLGADWAGETEEYAPKKLDSIIDTTPVWKPVVESLKNLKPGGRLVINAIRKEENDKDSLLKLNYERDLWLEKEIKSVANVTSNDLKEFLNLSGSLSVKPEVRTYKLKEANKAIFELKSGNIKGALVLVI
ncbi:MAG: zinc-dependent alcohol dehydrogenase family protein [Spirochaetes bacterium]|nr:zinc-dependent alcohol dehydrogenase family protein [Spirochaetota bacterium]